MKRIVKILSGMAVGVGVLSACAASAQFIDLKGWERVDRPRTTKFVHLSSPYFEQACNRENTIALPQTGGKFYGCAYKGVNVCTVYIPRPEGLTGMAFKAEADLVCKGWEYGGH